MNLINFIVNQVQQIMKQQTRNCSGKIQHSKEKDEKYRKKRAYET